MITILIISSLQLYDFWCKILSSLLYRDKIQENTKTLKELEALHMKYMKTQEVKPSVFFKQFFFTPVMCKSVLSNQILVKIIFVIYVKLLFTFFYFL